jgi:hypothetical protein
LSVAMHPPGRRRESAACGARERRAELQIWNVATLHEALKAEVPCVKFEVLSISSDDLHRRARVEIELEPAGVEPESVAAAVGRIVRGARAESFDAIRVDFYRPARRDSGPVATCSVLASDGLSASAD